MYFDQDAFDIRCEWGEQGIAQLAASSDAVVIVDVLSFSTAVEVAVSRGAIVYPFRWRDDRAFAYAEFLSATLASPRRGSTEGFSLSPNSLLTIPAGTRLVLPSPNGATLSLATGATPTLAGCLRNARAVARAAERVGSRISIIPAGERWSDGTLRPAIEDWIGAGAIINSLGGSKSSEALGAESVFLRFESALYEALEQCGSGKELIAWGMRADVELASMLNCSETAPRLVEGVFSHG